MNSTTLSNNQTDQRIQSIDILRGILIVLMALDHTRDYFMINAFSFSPTDPEQASVALFTTRWITHLCAPGFIWLTGISSYMYFIKNGVRKTSVYLLSRGLVLILLEFTVIKFAWHFNLDYSLLVLLVIWAIGASMILLAVACWFKQQTIFIIGILIIALHNLTDALIFDNRLLSFIWHILDQTGTFYITDSFSIKILYPILPMFGLICLGFGMGSLFTKESQENRISLLKRVALIFLLLFVSLRLLNEYGDPAQWVHNQYLYRTLFSFLNVTKYPMSLDYILITLSVLFYLFSLIESNPSNLYRPIALFGKVSMFFYITHLFVIHTLAVISVYILNGFEIDPHALDVYDITSKYGYPLPVVYVIWTGILLLLYPVCKKYRMIKSKYPDSFLKYI
ncbi:MAG: DUF1624 domain-containing protein [Cytophaga sp.]|uniref:DUF1624 domain-containing protein n=1 Tax=Cytophaga sp. TaxID=29535 RepID=UPI003F7F137C